MFQTKKLNNNINNKIKIFMVVTFGVILNVMFCLNLYNIPNNSKYNLLQKENYVTIVEEYGISSISINSNINIITTDLPVIYLTNNKILKSYDYVFSRKIIIWDWGSSARYEKLLIDFDL